MVTFTMSSLWDCQTHSVVSSGAVTVTPINVQQIPTDEQRTSSFSRNIRGVKESIILKAETTNDTFDADGEVSKIDFTGVAMRCKKERDMHDETNKNDVERPMSWEGELSDNEFKQEDMDEGIKDGIDMDSSDSNKEEYNDGKPKPLNFTNQVMMDQITDNVKANKMSNSEIPLLVDKLLGGSYSPVLASKTRTHIPPIPSPDSAIHSCYSPTQSPITSRHLSSSGFSSPSTFTPSLSRNNSDASQYGGSQHSSCYSHSYSSVSASPTQFSPTHSPVQIRHGYRTHSEYTSSSAGNNVYGINRLASSSSNSTEENNCHLEGSPSEQLPEDSSSSSGVYEERTFNGDTNHHSIGLNAAASSGISRQQLINSPCPICGDKISGFHYGIFSCESCKGFFKRTVQNHKNYVCLRGSGCMVTITTRKKCPACRFDKCLNMGMKLEAIRVDRTRGGRSTYPFSYTLPSNVTHAQSSSDLTASSIKQETASDCTSSSSSSSNSNRLVPRLLQEIMDVEHLWQYNERDAPTSTATDSSNKSNTQMDSVSNLCNIADHRLYKIVKWCKSLPLFKNISIDDQISLLINAWCELLLFSCCYRSMTTPGEIKVSLGKSISLNQAKELGLAPCIDRMLNFTEHLRRLRVDRYEYVAMKVIVLLSSDSSDLRQPEKARASQEKALQALQEYTVAHYPDIPSKFGELLLRIPDLQRTCQVGKEMLSIKHKEGEGPSFDLLMELLRGDH